MADPDGTACSRVLVFARGDVGPPTEEKTERRDPHPEKSEEGTEYVYLCVSQCK